MLVLIISFMAYVTEHTSVGISSSRILEWRANQLPHVCYRTNLALYRNSHPFTTILQTLHKIASKNEYLKVRAIIASIFHNKVRSNESLRSRVSPQIGFEITRPIIAKPSSLVNTLKSSSSLITDLSLLRSSQIPSPHNIPTYLQQESIETSAPQMSNTSPESSGAGNNPSVTLVIKVRSNLPNCRQHICWAALTRSRRVTCAVRKRSNVNQRGRHVYSASSTRRYAILHPSAKNARRGGQLSG